MLSLFFGQKKLYQLVEDEEIQAYSVVMSLALGLAKKDVVGEADVEGLLKGIASQLQNSGGLNHTELEDLLLKNN